MFYYRCKYVLDFYIVLVLSMLSQAVVFNKIFNLLYKQLVFIHRFFPSHFSARTKISQSVHEQSMSGRMFQLAETEGRLT